MDEIRSTRDRHVEAAVGQVFCGIPVDEQPHDSDTRAAKNAVLDILEAVFQMPAAGAAYGSLGWIKEQWASPKTISFADAGKFFKLMDRLVRYFISIGGLHGFPNLGEDEEVPQNEPYIAHKRVRRARGSNKAHKLLEFLNVSSVNKAITDLKNLGKYPVRIVGANMPSGKDWNNFAEVLYTFWIFYCKYEAIVRTSALARRVLVYIFFGLYDGPRQRKWPMIRVIHRLVTNGRHRFAAKCEEHFGELFKLLDKEPRLVAKLTDKGVGAVPYRFTAAVENGMRSQGDDLHAMGTNAMRSADDWTNVQFWMKRESYIASARRKLGRGSYCQWDRFSWSDYVERQTLAITFKVRHWPLSRGNKIWPDKLVLNPLRWSKPQPTKNKIVKKRTHAARAISTPAKKACAEKVDSPDVMIFDPKLGKLVCVLTDEAEEHDGGWESDA